MVTDKETGRVISYTAEDRAAALEVSLCSIASKLGYTPIRSGVHYTLKEMDSLIIYNDRTWHRWSKKGNINGGTQIDFLMEFGGAPSAQEAIKELLDFRGGGYEMASYEHHAQESERNERVMVLPQKNDNYRRLYAYLAQTRGISSEVISDFVHRKLIYEESAHHNIVYCGYDSDGNIRYAGMRGTADLYGKKFKADVPGNDKNYGVNIVNKSNSRLLVFESVIDCMSYIDMYKDNTSNKIVLGMVEDNPLVQFLKDYNHIKTIYFCLDNDEAAHKAMYGRVNEDGSILKKGLVKKYEEMGYEVGVISPPYGKDFNECLLAIRNGQAKLQDTSDIVPYSELMELSREAEQQEVLGTATRRRGGR
jgi:hypothetical protein